MPAQRRAREIARAVTFEVENDVLSVRGAGPPPDYDYTSGFRLIGTRAVAPRSVQHLAPVRLLATALGGGPLGLRYTLTHRIYTPRSNADTLIAGERPYAGVLFGSVELLRIRPSAVGARDGHSRALGLDVGVVGPLSFAQDVQNGLHRVLDNTPRVGWGNQLANAPLVTLRYEEGLRVERAAGDRGRLALDLRAGAELGTLSRMASASADVVYGFGRAAPWSPQEARVTAPTRYFVLAGYAQELVGRNALVEGHRGIPGATRYGHVGQFSAGLGIRGRGLAASYRHNLRGREYRAQPSAHPYGSLVLTWTRY